MAVVVQTVTDLGCTREHGGIEVIAVGADTRSVPVGIRIRIDILQSLIARKQRPLPSIRQTVAVQILAQGQIQPGLFARITQIHDIAFQFNRQITGISNRNIDQKRQPRP